MFHLDNLKKFRLDQLQPEIRHLFDMREVIFDQKWLKTAPNLELYYMYRGLARNQADAKKIKKAGLRYDITIIPAQMLGCEFVKTAGHDHTRAPLQQCTFTEIYEVISGQALYLMQKIERVSLRGGATNAVSRDDAAISREEAQQRRRPTADKLKTTIKDVYAVYAQPGDKVIIPPNYGHVTINAAKTELVMSNWMANWFKSDYTLFRQKQGACYYALLPCRDALQCVSTKNSMSLRGRPTARSLAITRDRLCNLAGGAKRRSAQQDIIWQSNSNYDPVPSLRFSQPTNFPEFGLDKNKPMYDLISDLSKLDFLKRPQDFTDLWQKIKSLR